MTGVRDGSEEPARLRNRLAALGLTHGVDPSLSRLVPLMGNHSVRPLTGGLSGVYLWTTTNGEAYVGQARDLRARLRTHRRDHADLLDVAVRLISLERLDAVERLLAHDAERIFALRNVKLVSATAKPRPLDTILSREDQAWFVKHGNRPEWRSEARPDMTEQVVRRRCLQRAFDLRADSACFVRRLTRLIWAVVPRPSATEMQVWSVTFLPPARARINIGQQEVATVESVHPHGEHRILSPRRFQPSDTKAHYVTGDLEIWLDSPKLRRFLASPPDVQAWRERAIWLARHTSPLHVRSHCPWLYDPRPTGLAP